MLPVCTCLSLLPAAIALLLPPQVTSMMPLGGQRGTEVAGHVLRPAAPRAAGLLQLRPGLEVVGTEPGKDDRCRVTLRITADCPLGAHPLRLRTAAGLANLTVFHVGALPEVQERPDGGIQRLSPGVTVNGTLRGEEQDRYALALEAGARIACEVEAMRLGIGPIDLALSVSGPDGAEVGSQEGA